MDLNVQKVSKNTSIAIGVSPDASPMRKRKIETAFKQIVRQVTLAPVDMDDAVDLDYKTKGVHYKQY